MRCHLVLTICVWLLFTSQAAISDDVCPIATFENSSDSKIRLAWEEINFNTVPINCSCAITADKAISKCSFIACPSVELLDLISLSLPCPCLKYDLTISPTCITTSTDWICQLVDTKADSCQIPIKFKLSLSTKPSISCDARWTNNNKDLVVIIQPIEIDDADLKPKPKFEEGTCNAGSVTTDAPSTTVTQATSIYLSSTKTAEKTKQSDNQSIYSSTITTVEMANQSDDQSVRKSGLAIGIGVGVGGGVLIILAIVVVFFILRRRRADSSKDHASIASETAAAVPSETAYESYTIPVTAAYDNTNNGTMQRYQAIVYDDKKVDESDNAYTEVNDLEASTNQDCNDSSNDEFGGNKACSRVSERKEDYDNVTENPSKGIENETTLIENEFYG